MTLFLVLVLVALMISVVVVLIRGLVSFLGNARAEIDGTGPGPSEGALKSNKLMWSRIYLQGAAIGVIALIALVASSKG